MKALIFKWMESDRSSRILIGRNVPGEVLTIT